MTEAVLDADAIATPHTCVRCSCSCLLAVAGRCADCIADMGLRHSDEYQVWKTEVREEFGPR